MKHHLPVLICLCLFVFSGITPCYPADRTMDPAPCIKLNQLDISGNKQFSTLRLKLRTKLWSTTLVPFAKTCLNLDWLKKDKQDLVSFYRKKGFADATVTHEIVTRNNGQTLCLIVDEGLEYRIDIKGAEFFHPWQLKGEIPIFERGNLQDAGLRKGVMNIRKRYHEKGFKDVTVSFTKEKTTLKDRTYWDVIFFINEKTRMRVASIKIDGNRSISTDVVHKEMGLSEKGFLKNDGFSQRQLDDDIKAIKRLYLAKGFKNASIKSDLAFEDNESIKEQSGIDVHIRIIINEHDQILVKEVSIRGLGTLLDEGDTIRTLALKPGEPFREYMVKSDENTIAALVSHKGYPHVGVKAKPTITNDTAVHLLFTVDPGPFVRVGKIRYTGNTRLKEQTMQDLLEIKPNDPFSLQDIVNAEKRLRKIGAIQAVRIQAGDLKEKKTTADLEVIVKEKKPYYVETALGHDTERLFYLNAQTGDNNSFGRDIDSWLKAEVSGIGFEGETGIKDPFFLETDMTASVSVFVQKKEELNNDFGVRAWGISGNLTKPILPHLNAGLSLTYENRARFGDEENYNLATDPGDEYDTRNILKTSLALAYDTRDSVVRPRSGIFSSLTTDIYTGFSSDLDDFIKYTLDVRRYLTPMERVTFALRTRLGYIQPISAPDAIAEDRLFFLGGTSDVRGFKENLLVHDIDMDPVGGMSMVSASLESRISLTEKLEWIMFLDTGRLGETTGAAVEQEFRSSVGGGFSYGTVIGPISLLYGYKLNRDEYENPGRIHFSFGYTF